MHQTSRFQNLRTLNPWIPGAELTRVESSATSVSTHEVRLREGIIPRHAQVGVTTLVTRIGGLSFNTCCANSAGLFSGLFCLPRGLFSQRWPDPRDLLWTRSDGTLMGIFLFQGIFVCLDLVKKMPLSGSLLWRHTDFGCVSQAHIVVRIVLVSFQVSFTCE